VRNGIVFHPVKRMEEVVELAFPARRKKTGKN